jgi:hypothetical protein
MRIYTEVREREQVQPVLEAVREMTGREARSTK